MTRIDLTSYPWVPIVRDAARREVSLREALREAHKIDGLALDNVLEAVAIFRQVLLPAVLHAFGVPRATDEWADRFALGCFDPDTVDRYCDEHAPRFDLFHPTQPFAQIAGLRTVNDAVKPVSVLLPSVASGNNVPLFSARTDADPPELDSAQAARAVLVAQCWDPAGLKTGAAGDPSVARGTTAGNPTGPLGQLGVVIPMGPTLFETLLLNVPVLPHGVAENDRPQWASPALDQTWRKDGRPDGLLSLLTWQSRRIRLVPHREISDAIRVSSAVLCAGDRLVKPSIDVEPHTAWRGTEPRTPVGQPRRPVRHDARRFGWRTLPTLAATDQPSEGHHHAPPVLVGIAELINHGILASDFPLSALIVGVVYGTQQAVVDDLLSEVLPLPVQIFVDHTGTRETLLSITAQAESLREAANRLGDELRIAAGGDKIPWDRGQRPGDILIDQLTGPVHRILARLQCHPVDAGNAGVVWRAEARRLAIEVAEQVLEAAPRTTFFGRPVSRPNSVHRGYRYDRLALAHDRFLGALTEILGHQHEVDSALAAISAARKESTPV